MSKKITANLNDDAAKALEAIAEMKGLESNGDVLNYALPMAFKRLAALKKWVDKQPAKPKKPRKAPAKKAPAKKAPAKKKAKKAPAKKKKAPAKKAPAKAPAKAKKAPAKVPPKG